MAEGQMGTGSGDSVTEERKKGELGEREKREREKKGNEERKALEERRERKVV